MATTSIRLMMAAASLALVSLGTACSGSSGDPSASDSPASSAVSSEDAYAVGCPLLDASVGAGSVARKVAVTTLKGVRSSDALDGDQKQWVNDAIDVLQNDHPNDAPKDVRTKVVDECASHGHTLSNLDKN